MNAIKYRKVSNRVDDINDFMKRCSRYRTFINFMEKQSGGKIRVDKKRFIFGSIGSWTEPYHELELDVEIKDKMLQVIREELIRTEHNLLLLLGKEFSNQLESEEN